MTMDQRVASGFEAVGTKMGEVVSELNTFVKSVNSVTPNSSGNVNITMVTGNAGSATKLQTARTISLTGDVSGSVSFDGQKDVSITATVADDSHNHVISNVDGLQSALDAKAALASPTFTGTPKAPTAAAGTNTTQLATTAFVTTAVANKTSVTSATKATQDASGNVITSTYATKAELNAIDTSALIPKTGDRGELAGYQSVFLTTDAVSISANAKDVIQLRKPSTITVQNGEEGKYWSKMVNTLSKSNSIQLDSKWVWCNSGYAKEELTTPNNIYVFRWCHDFGLVDVIEGAPVFRTITGTISLVDSEADVVVQRDGEIIYTFASGGTYTCELAVGDKFGDGVLTVNDANNISIDGGFVTSVFDDFSASVSLSTAYTEENPFISSGGRQLYRHSSGLGTVIKFNDGQERKVLVLDAQHRFSTEFAMSGQLANLPTIGIGGSWSDDSWFAPDGSFAPSSSVIDFSHVTDAYLNDFWADLIDPNTAKYNTERWYEVDGFAAAMVIDNYYVDRNACAIPNFQTLLRIMCERVNLDLFDPTASDYPTGTLSKWLYDGVVWSSTLTKDTADRDCMLSFYINGNMYAPYFSKPNIESRGLAIPVLELE